MKYFVCVYNPNSGKGNINKGRVEQIFKNRPYEIDFVEISHGIGEVKAKIAQRTCDALIAAGGDGTVSLVASWAIEINVPLGVLPVGTLNHFAKDAKLPLEIKEAAEVILNPKITKVDYCTVNDKVFMNNSSIGLYPSSVLWRESNDHKYGKWTAAVIAFSRALLHHRTISVRIESEELNEHLASPLIFVGNNNYQIDKVGLASRDTLTAGRMFIYAVCSKGPIIFIKRAILSTLGRPNLKKDFLLESQHPVTLESRQDRVNVAIDGEVVALRFPLKYEIFAGGLSVCLPK